MINYHFKKKIATFVVLFFFNSIIYAQRNFSIEYSLGTTFSYSTVLSQTDNLNLIQSLPIKSIAHGFYITTPTKNKFDLILGIEYNRNGIKASTNTKEQQYLYNIPNLASAETMFYYGNWSLPILFRYNYQYNNSIFSLYGGIGYTYSRNRNVNPRCFYGSGTVNDTIPFVSGSVFCMKDFNKVSEHHIFFKSGVGYDYDIKKIGKVGLKLDFNLGMNLMDEALYDITFLNGDNYETLIGNKGHQIRLSIIYKWTK
jgi:hypothetical protein